MRKQTILLRCVVCGKSWGRASMSPNREPAASCPKCREDHRGTAMRTHWKHRRRRLELAREVVADAGPPPPETLEELMRQADRASARALEAALSIAVVKKSER